MVLIRERIPTYEDGRQDAVTAEGDVVSISPGDDFEIDDRTEPVAAVSLGERALILTEMARVYAEYAEAAGMVRLLSIPGQRAKLKARYGDSYEQIVKDKMAKAKADLALEDARVERLMKRTELRAAGFDPLYDADTDHLLIKMGIRRAIGISV